MKFRELLELIEAVKSTEFSISINGKEFKVQRGPHLIELRTGDTKPKDYTLSINKYRELFERFYKRKTEVNISKPISITWESKNGLNNIISFDIKGSVFKIFGCIVNSSKHHDKLYPKYTNRIFVGII